MEAQHEERAGFRSCAARLVDVRKDEKAEAEQVQARRDRARVIELEEEADALRSKLLRAHSENTKRERVLEKRLWDARDALSGCVKLEQQERTIAGANRLQAVNVELEKINRRLSDQKVDLESKLEEHELRIESERELKKLQQSVERDTKDQALRDMNEKVLNCVYYISTLGYFFLHWLWQHFLCMYGIVN